MDKTPNETETTPSHKKLDKIDTKEKQSKMNDKSNTRL